MDPLEGSMMAGEELADRHLVARSRAESVDPISDQGGDLGVVGRLHSPTEGVDVVPAPVPRPLVVVGVRVWCDLPYRRHDKAMDMSNLGEGHESAAHPTAIALLQQRLDLPSYQRVAFKGGGAVGFVVPDVLPDGVCLFRRR